MLALKRMYYNQFKRAAVVDLNFRAGRSQFVLYRLDIG